METNKWSWVLVGGAVVLMAALTVKQAVAISETASADSAEASSASEGPPSALASPAAIRPATFQARADACFDVALNEAAACRADEASRPERRSPSLRLPPNVCFDVPLREPCDE